MKYIQIDNFNGVINIVQDEDNNVKIFDNLQEAKDTLEINCQNGFIVPLNVDIMKLIEDCVGLLNSVLDYKL